MEREVFEKLVEEGIARIPEQFRKLIDNVAFFVEDEPSALVREKEGLGPHETLLGYYHGIPTDERGEGYGGLVMPDTIFIYQKPIEEEAGRDPERIREVVAETVWHEIGHHFGLDEHEVRAREHKKFPRTI